MNASDPLWYKDAVLYELHVRAFQDSDGDGIGDFRGLTERLDYLRDLGVTALWLLPFYPSPLRDDGYDIADYTDVHDHYGTLHDFRRFLDEAHRRGLRVVTELVLNHTSDQHPWFQRARRSPPGAPERDFYVWSDAPDAADLPARFREARVIFQDFERSNWAWDPVAKSYYWHRFYSHQPDLNYDNPAVVEAVLGVVDFWMDLGVDGLRLDAAPYLYEREGTSCENLPETYDFLRLLRRHVDERYPGRMLLAEANQWPEDAAAYFGGGDACHMAFHFPLMPRMFMAIHMEDRLPIVDILAQTPEIPADCQWAIFLRNHDELTLEMVTDEERDYMNRVYAREAQARINLGIRRRLAPLMRNHRRRIELMNGLLLSLPGTPVIYYGDEIGMGDNIYLGDRNGVRTPMQWSPDRNAGFSRGNPQSLYLPAIIDPEYHFETVNVESQAGNPHSLLSWMRRLLALRKRHRAFGRGGLEFLRPDNDHILAFLRRHESETILVVANLSRFVQPVDLDLAEFRGLRPVELFGRVEFPTIEERPYPLTVGPHAFYWFALEPATPRPAAEPGGAGAADLPEVAVAGGWGSLLEAPNREAVQDALRAYLARRQFCRESRSIRYVEAADAVPLGDAPGAPTILLLDVEYDRGQPARLQVPVALAPADPADAPPRRADDAIARLRGDVDGLLVDAATDAELGRSLLRALAEGRSWTGLDGRLATEPAPSLGPLGDDEAASLPATPLPGHQNHTSVALGDRFVLKLFRCVDSGPNPDLELPRFLSAEGFPHVPRFVGSLLYERGRAQTTALAMIQAFVPNRGTAWDTTRESLGRFFDRVLTRPERREAPTPVAPLLDLSRASVPPPADELIGDGLAQARLIGRRTGELHRALASRADLPDFRPEPFSGLDLRSLSQSMRGRARRVLRRLGHALDVLPEPDRDDAAAVLRRQEEILERSRALLRRKVAATKIRLHGDYHLGQLLRSGDDYVIIDFEGQSGRTLSERRLKGSPLVDVTGMVNSFRYAALSSLRGSHPEGGGDDALLRRDDLAILDPWARSWAAWTSAAFLRAYLDVVAGAGLLPGSDDDLRTFLEAYRLDRSLDSLGYELDHRPAWASIPLRAILDQLDAPPDSP